MTDARLQAMLTEVAALDAAVRVHLSATRGSASEQARGQAAYRHTTALRRALEEWIETRKYRAAETTT